MPKYDPPKVPLSVVGDPGPNLMPGFSSTSESISQTASRSAPSVLAQLTRVVNAVGSLLKGGYENGQTWRSSSSR